MRVSGRCAELATAITLRSAGGVIGRAASFAIFASGRAWEQLRNSICYPNLNVKVVATHGGITVGCSEMGERVRAVQQAVADLATFAESKLG